MNIETVKVVINADGQVMIEVDGAHGPVCLQVTEDIVKMLGGEVLSQQLTTEYYEEQGVSEHIRVSE
ncbi:MAG: DUF2997 domain-containing protein [Candidatus Obscuribacterales bacterium]|nr:DUF2997 domain-containing protein [Candidatus Obscuribacterales bacterium]